MRNQKTLLCLIFYAILFSFYPLPTLSQEFGDLINVSNNQEQYDTEPVIAIDKDNHVHIAWTGAYYNPEAPDGVAYDIFYSNNISGSFSTPPKINVPTDWYSREPSIAVDMLGNAHIAFRRSTDQIVVKNDDDIYYVTNATGSFDNPIRLIDGHLPGATEDSAITMPRQPDIHYDKQGCIHITFFAGGSLLYMKNLGGQWSKPEIVVHTGVSTSYQSCLDADNNIHIVYRDRISFTVEASFYTNNVTGQFAEPVQVSSPDHVDAMMPIIDVDSQGNAHIVYKEPFYTYYDLYYVNNTSGSFNSWIPLCGKGFGSHNILIDDSDFIHIAYRNSATSGGKLFYKNNINGNFDTFTTYDQMSKYWTHGSRYFALGNFSTLHFSVCDWTGAYMNSDTEIFYIQGIWNTIAVEEIQITNIPTEYRLYQNFPNPFNSSTTIHYDLIESCHVNLKVYNILGEIIKTLVDENQLPGSYKIILKANNLQSGVYFVTLKTAFCHFIKKITLIK